MWMSVHPLHVLSIPLAQIQWDAMSVTVTKTTSLEWTLRATCTASVSVSLQFQWDSVHSRIQVREKRLIRNQIWNVHISKALSNAITETKIKRTLSSLCHSNFMSKIFSWKLKRCTIKVVIVLLHFRGIITEVLLLSAVSRLLSYGTEVGDSLVETVSELTGERVSPLIAVPDGLPIYGGNIANSVYVSHVTVSLPSQDESFHLSHSLLEYVLNSYYWYWHLSRAVQLKGLESSVSNQPCSGFH